MKPRHRFVLAINRKEKRQVMVNQDGRGGGTRWEIETRGSKRLGTKKNQEGKEGEEVDQEEYQEEEEEGMKRNRWGERGGIRTSRSRFDIPSIGIVESVGSSDAAVLLSGGGGFFFLI